MFKYLSVFLLGLCLVCFFSDVFGSDDTAEPDQSLCTIAGERSGFSSQLYEKVLFDCIGLNRDTIENIEPFLDERKVDVIFKSFFHPSIDMLSTLPILQTISLRLNFSNQEFTLAELRDIVSIVRNNPALIGFSLRYPLIWSEERLVLNRLLTAFLYRNNLVRNLLEIFTYNFNPTVTLEEEQQIIREGLSSNISLKIINLVFSGDSGVRILEDIRNNQSIESANFCFFHRRLQSGELGNIAFFIENSQNLKSLHLSCFLSNEILLQLATSLTSQDHLKTLVLKDSARWREKSSNDHLLLASWKAFFHSVGSLMVLQLEVDLSCSGIAQALAEALKATSTLTTLAIPDNCVGDAGVTTLTNALEENLSLTQLDFSRNRITDLGANSILNVLSKNKNLRHVWLGENYFLSSSSSTRYNDNYHYNQISQCQREKIQRILQERIASDSLNRTSEDAKKPSEILIDTMNHNSPTSSSWE